MLDTEKLVIELLNSNKEKEAYSLIELSISEVNYTGLPPYLYTVLLGYYVDYHPAKANKLAEELKEAFPIRKLLHCKIDLKLGNYYSIINSLSPYTQLKDASKLQILGEAYFGNNELENAILCYRKSIDLEPSEVGYLKLARAVAVLNSWDAEKDILEELKIKYPSSFKLMLHRLRRFLSFDKLHKAKELFEVLNILFGTKRQTKKLELLLLLHLEEYDVVIEKVEEFPEYLKQDEVVFLRKIRAFHLKGDITKALIELELRISTSTSRDIHIYYLQLLMETYHVNERLDIQFDNYLGLYEVDHKFLLLKARYLSRDHVSLGIRFLVDNYTLLNRRCKLFLVSSYNELLEYEKSLSLISQELRMSNDVHFAVAEVDTLLKMNEYEKSHSLIEKYRRVYSDDKLLIQKEAILYMAERKYRIALKIFDKLDVENVSNAVLFSKIECLLELGENDAALKKLGSMSGSALKEHRYYNLLALCLKDSGLEYLQDNILNESITTRFLSKYIQIQEELGHLDLLLKQLNYFDFVLKDSRRLDLILKVKVELQRLTNIVKYEEGFLSSPSRVFQLQLRKVLDEFDSGHQWISDNIRLLDIIEDKFSEFYLYTRQCASSALKIAMKIIEAIKRKKGFSLIRLGDGEGNIMNYSTYKNYNDIDREEIQKIWWGKSKIGNYDKLNFEFEEVIDNADVIGISEYLKLFTMDYYKGISPPYSRHSRGDLMVNSYISEARKNLSCVITSSFIHFDLESWGLFDYIFSGVNSCSYISCHSSLDEYLENTFSITVTRKWIIPPEDKWKKHMDIANDDIHYPNVYKGICEELNNLKFEGELILVAAGFLGKFYCDLIKRQGGIAIDIGGLADFWMGYNTRPSMPKYSSNTSLSYLFPLLNESDAFLTCLNKTFIRVSDEQVLTHLWINLVKDIERRSICEKQFSNFQIVNHWVPGVTPKDFPKIKHSYLSEKSMSKGEIGCLLAHLNCYKTMILNNLNVAFIQEDDLIITNKIDYSAIMDSAPEDWEILHLYTSNPERVNEDYNKFLNKGLLWSKWEEDSNYWCTMSYIIKKSAAQRILKTLFNDKDELDLSRSVDRKPVADHILYSLCKTYVLSYPLFYAIDKDSNIHQSHIMVHRAASQLRKKQQILEQRKLKTSS